VSNGIGSDLIDRNIVEIYLTMRAARWCREFKLLTEWIFH